MNFFLLFSSSSFSLQPQTFDDGDLWRKDSHSQLKLFFFFLFMFFCVFFFRFYCFDIESFEFFYDGTERLQNVDVTRK